MRPTLVILAAGIGSRFGGLKQLTPVTHSGESIIDFSIYDAIRAGYKRIILVIRKETLTEFRKLLGVRVEKSVDLLYAFQDMDQIAITGRQKPFGTAHAVMTASSMIDGPFSVINADDYYGPDSFEKACNFFNSDHGPSDHSLIGYRINNTLSEHGAVSRAECKVDKNEILLQIRELHSVYKRDAKLYYKENNEEHPLKDEILVSMNFWNFQPQIMDHFEKYWIGFKKTLHSNPDAEYLIPEVANTMIRNSEGSFHVIPTSGPWFGITYMKDKTQVQKGIQELIKTGLYPSPLWRS